MAVNRVKLKLYFLFLLIAPAAAFSSPLYSPTWGFRLDLPEGYQYAEGNNIDRYSFQGPNGAKFDVAVYAGAYRNISEMAADVKRRLSNAGDTAFFQYLEKEAAIMELRFQNFSGWGLCVELDAAEEGKPPPLMLALAYAPAAGANVELLHLCALDSIVPSESEMRYPGPVTEFSFPRGGQVEAPIAGTELKTLIGENDADAAQSLIDREYTLLSLYQSAPNWQEAWARFYRAIYRDSWHRVADAAFRLERLWNTGAGAGERAFAEKALAWVQGFSYERDISGSDFVNLVSAVTEGRGDCDSRAMLWAIVLSQADIPAGMMVSEKHSHAMGLADIEGPGARFEAYGVKWLVAETTDKVGIGLIAQEMSGTESWLGVFFE